ncbi:MAG: ribonuclease R [Burkholderiales bacterium]|jgi:ribonuclease R|nr:ribonuclease R [Burkholderiales bacterium]
MPKKNVNIPLIGEDQILDAIKTARAPLLPEDLITRLRVKTENRATVLAKITELIKRGALFENRKGALFLPEAIDLVVGTVIGHPDGYGFLKPDDGGDDFYLPPSEMFKALHGDRVTARRLYRNEHGKTTAEILDVLQHAQSEIVGRLHQKHGVWFVVAEDRRLNQDFLLSARGRGKAQDGDIVAVEIVEPPLASREAIVRVKEVLGRDGDDGIEIEIALRKHALPFRFDKEALREARRFGKEVKEEDKNTRIDLRNVPFVTIDGETARDFDDAVFAEKRGRGFRLFVAIADVAHYVRDGSALDKEACERGTSVYFPRRVIPMLPEELSNGLCSLNPQTDRLVMVCDMQISTQGAIRQYTFYPAVIRSQARLTYTQVWNYLSGKKSGSTIKNAAQCDSLDTLYSLSQKFLVARQKRGAIDFETTEMQIEFDRYGKIVTITPLVRNDAHRLIEECMLAANVSAAHFILTRRAEALYRIHEGPTPEKLAALKSFLSLCSLPLGGGDKPTAKDYARLLKQVETRDDKELLQTLLLRSLQRAEYSNEEKGHFGLSYDHYTHFTSPIRRYPDLLIHRRIKSLLTQKSYHPVNGAWKALGAHCSMTERRADEASREVETWLKCIYMQQHLGKVMTGTISGVTHFGLFVTLDGLAIDGLIHISELGTDYFRFDATRHALIGQRSGVTYQLAERVTVRVIRVDPNSGKIDFTLSDEIAPDRKQTKKQKRTRAENQ